MPTYTANTAKHFTTAASPTIDDTTLTSYGAEIQVIHRGSADPIYFRVGRNAASTPAPALVGDNNYVVMPGQSVIVPWPAESAGATVCVETICASAQGCSIQVLPTRQI